MLASGTKGQAKKIITEKIVSLYNTYPRIRDEIGDIKNIKVSQNETYVQFPNGSKISAETSTDSSRGLRCNILIVDEFRLVNKKMIDEVLKPMMNVNRVPAFKNKPEYANYPTEENKEIYISSAWYKSHWIWDYFVTYLHGMLDGGSYFVAVLPYQLSVFHGLLSKKLISDVKTADNFDPTTFNMEYEAIFVGENDKSFFKLQPLNKIRTVNKTFLPPTDVEFVANKQRSKPKVLSNIPRIDTKNEIRLVALDVALAGGNKQVKNDTSAFTLMRLHPSGDGYTRDILYLESISRNITTKDLAIRLKQLYYDFEADYVVMDANGNGLGVFDELCDILYDKDRDMEYPPWASINSEEANNRTGSKGTKVIYSVKATADFNNMIAVSLKANIENGKLRLPISDIEKREELVNEGGFVKKTPEEQMRLMYPYLQATALVTELVNLEYDVRQSGVRIKEVGKATKDRYSSLAYGNYYANEMEKELKSDGPDDLLGFLFISNGSM